MSKSPFASLCKYRMCTQWETLNRLSQNQTTRRLYRSWLVCDLNRTPIVMAKHGGSCVHFSGLSTCGRTSRETVSHPQRQPLPTPRDIDNIFHVSATPYKIALPVYDTVTNKRLLQKHHLNLLSSITKTLLTHTLASFWRKQSCMSMGWRSLSRWQSIGRQRSWYILAMYIWRVERSVVFPCSHQCWNACVLRPHNPCFITITRLFICFHCVFS